MRMMILAGAVLALSACGGGESEANNTMAADNMMVDPMMDPNLSMNAMDPAMTGNMGADMGGAAGANGAMDANTANMMAVDANTNSPDTNLANGL